jgi:hypothetical protein
MKKPALTPLEKRRAAYARLLTSLPVRQHTSIASPQINKQKPAAGVFASI